MLQSEFEQRVKMPVSFDEYKAIEINYMNSDVDKDEFCKAWAKINKKRIAAYIKAKQEEKRLADLKHKAFKLHESIGYLSFEKSIMTADDYLTESQKKVLAYINISLYKNEIDGWTGYEVKRYKSLMTVKYELGKYAGMYK